MDTPRPTDEELFFLKAKQDILDTMADYWWYMDTKQWDKWGDAFTADVRVILQGVELDVGNRDEWVRMNSEEFLATQITAHQGHQFRVFFTSPTTATGRYILNDVLTDIESGETMQHGFGFYVDDYERGADGKWRIKVLRLDYFRTGLDLGNADSYKATPVYDVLATR